MSRQLFKGVFMAVVGLVLATSPAEARGGYGHGGSYHYGHHHSGGDDWVYGLVGGLLGFGLGAALGSMFTAPQPVYAPPLAPPPAPPPSYAPPPAPSAYPLMSTSTAAPDAQPVPAPAGVLDAVPTSPPYLSASGSYCREFQAHRAYGGVMRPIVGTACQGPDGVWRVVR